MLECEVTWNDAMDIYDNYKSACTNSFVENSYGLVELMKYYNPKEIAEVDARMLVDFVNRCHENGRSKSFVYHSLGHIKSFLKWCWEENYLERIPRFPRYRFKKTPGGRALTDQEYGKLLKSASCDESRYLIAGMRHSGMRVSEASSFSWDDMSVPHVSTNQGCSMLVFPANVSKNGLEQCVPATPDMVSLLSETPIRDRHGLVFSKNILKRLEEKYRKKPLVNFKDREKKVAKACRVEIMNAAKKADIWVSPTKRASSHDLRRTFATYWAQRLFPAQLKVLMRHEHIETTMKAYVSIDPHSLAGTLNGFGSPSPIEMQTRRYVA